MITFNGLQVVVDQMLVKKQARIHAASSVHPDREAYSRRVNKKWLKRYGEVQDPNRVVVAEAMGVIVCSPAGYERLKELAKERNETLDSDYGQLNKH